MESLVAGDSSTEVDGRMSRADSHLNIYDRGAQCKLLSPGSKKAGRMVVSGCEPAFA